METFRRWQCETVYPNFEPPTFDGELSSGSAITVDNNSLLPKRGGAVETLPLLLGIQQAIPDSSKAATQTLPAEPANGKIDAEEVARLNEERYKKLAQRCSNAVDRVESANTEANVPTSATH